MSRRIESHVEKINCPAEQVFNFLSDFNNFSRLLPEQVANWQATADACSFEVKGLASLGLRITEKTPFSRIVMTGEGKIPFSFDITTSITMLSPAICQVQLGVNSGMSAIMAMMAERPLTNFIETLVSKLREIMEAKIA